MNDFSLCRVTNFFGETEALSIFPQEINVEDDVKYWEIIADNLSKIGWSWGCVSGMDSRGRTIFVADAHSDDNQHHVVRADEKLAAFVELESAIREHLSSEKSF